MISNIVHKTAKIHPRCEIDGCIVNKQKKIIKGNRIKSGTIIALVNINTNAMIRVPCILSYMWYNTRIRICDFSLNILRLASISTRYRYIMQNTINNIAVVGTGVIGSGWIIRFLANSNPFNYCDGHKYLCLLCI